MIQLNEHGNLLYGNEVRDRFIYPTKEEIIEAVSKQWL